MTTSDKYGFVTGVDKNQQWMLPWWLENIQAYHTEEEITICDFGMTEEWAEFAQKHSDHYLKFPVREECAWFYKPLALAKTPNIKKCWIDLDCEIMENISDIFKYTRPDKIACANDPYHSWGCRWQTGVFAIENNSKLLEMWVYKCINISNRGDQEVLWDIVKDNDNYISQIPDEYNWLRKDVETKRKWSIPPKVIHWTGDAGKKVIKKKINQN